MKILNLYANIGGNRKLWGDEHDITAIEYDPIVANIYTDFFPNDKMIMCDAHQYLADHYQEFDFIWSSIPCTKHTTFAKMRGLSDDFRSGNHKYKPGYPDFKLYEEIVFLQHFYKGDWIVENVIPYYEPLIPAQKIQRHLFWSNHHLEPGEFGPDNIKHGKISEWEKKLGFDLSKYKNINKRQILRNCVDPKLGLYIFECATKNIQQKLF